MDGNKFLELNQAMRIQPEESARDEWSASTLQDIDSKAFYIAIPIRRNVPLMLREGERVHVQIPGPTGIVVFNTKVLGWRRDAIPLIGLVLPDKVERIERRSFVRLSVLLEASLAELPGEGKGITWTKGQMIDISGGGIRMAVRKNIKKGVRVMVTFKLPLSSTTDTVISEGEIMRAQEASQSGVYQLGIQFINLDSKYQDMVIRFIFEKLKEAGRMRSETGL